MVSSPAVPVVFTGVGETWLATVRALEEIMLPKEWKDCFMFAGREVTIRKLSPKPQGMSRKSMYRIANYAVGIQKISGRKNAPATRSVFVSLLTSWLVQPACSMRLSRWP
jgi:hypothetical protein